MFCGGLKVNSLWPNDAVRWHRSGSVLSQAVAHCLMATVGSVASIPMKGFPRECSWYQSLGWVGWVWKWQIPKASFSLCVLLLSASVFVSVCVFVRACVCSSINHRLVHPITCQSLKQEPPNLEQKCKTPWLRSLLFWRWLTQTFKVEFNLKVQISLCLVYPPE